MFALRHFLTKSRYTMSQQLLTSKKIDELLKFVSSLPSGGGAYNPRTAESKEAECKNGERFYITTAINYTNGLPHIGHAYEAVTSDVIARYHRIYGRNVFFLTGTDEHGQKVANTAASKGFQPKEFCDKNVAVFKELNQKLEISNDHYIRTTDPDHYVLAKKMFKTAYDNGDIYKAQYEGWYDVRNEKFLTETQAKETNYIDPVSKQPYTKQSEETYFFRMGKYQERLLDHLRKNPKFIEPEKSYQLIYRRLTTEKLEDLCVSRSTFTWGVPVPIDDKHIIYVWFDALSNYLTGIKYFERDTDLYKFWPANVHVIGKDIVWFHTVIWPCILMSCNIPLPAKVFCHGFVMDKAGEKMSKSIGNVVDPFEVLKKHNADSLRYFICTQATFGNDMRWNNDDLQKRHDAHLAHIYGNLVNRALKLCKSQCGGKIPTPDAYEDIFNLTQLALDTDAAFSKYDISGAAELVMDALRKCNDWITKKEPWKIKNNPTEKAKVIRTILECIYILAHFMEPYTPRASQQVFHDLNHERTAIQQLNDFNNLRPNTKITVGAVLFTQHSRKVDKKAENKDKPVIARCDFKVGKILSVELHPRDERLYVESIDLGERKPRTIVSGLAAFYKDKNELVNKKVIVFANLKYSKFKGVESQGMVMCASSKGGDNETVKVLEPPQDAEIGESLAWNNSRDYKPDDSINIGKKNSFWKKDIAPKLITDKDGNMAFDGVTFTAANGQCITSPLPNTQIS